MTHQETFNKNRETVTEVFTATRANGTFLEGTSLVPTEQQELLPIKAVVELIQKLEDEALFEKINAVIAEPDFGLYLDAERISDSSMEDLMFWNLCDKYGDAVVEMAFSLYDFVTHFANQ